MSDKDPYKLSRRTAARYGAIQALHQLHERDDSMNTSMHQFESHYLNMVPETEDDLDLRHADRTLFESLFEGVVNEKETLIELVSAHLAEGWTFDRLEPTLRWILLLATFEILRSRELPSPIILNEYINATKDFASLKEASFVNGVLHGLVVQIRKEEQHEIPTPVDSGNTPETI